MREKYRVFLLKLGEGERRQRFGENWKKKKEGNKEKLEGKRVNEGDF